MLPKPSITDDTFSLDPSVLDELISHLSTLAAIYTSRRRRSSPAARGVPTLGAGDRDDDDDEDGIIASDMMGSDDLGGSQGSAPTAAPAVDLLGGLMDDLAITLGAAGGRRRRRRRQRRPRRSDDLFGGPTAPPAQPSAPQHKVTLPGDKGDGMQIRSAFASENGRPVLQITIENGTAGPLSGFAIQFNKNSFGLVPETPASLGQCLPQQIMPGQSASGSCPLLTNGPLSDSKGVVQMAIKTNVKVSYFQDAADLCLFLTKEGRLEQGKFLEMWRGGQGTASR